MTFKRRWQVAYRDIDGRLIKASPHWTWKRAERERVALLRLEIHDARQGIPPLYSAVVERTDAAMRQPPPKPRPPRRPDPFKAS